MVGVVIGPFKRRTDVNVGFVVGRLRKSTQIQPDE